jgi:hypothetical protein
MFTKSRLAPVMIMAVILGIGVPALAGASSSNSSSTTTSLATTTTTTNQVIVSGFSEKGDYIFKGVSSVYGAHWAKVAATTTGIYLSYLNPANKSFATFSFDPVAGQTFSVGNYDNVQRAAYRSAGFPGIEITGPGRPTGCTRITGSFHIWNIASDAGGNITRLDLTYVEHCAAGRPSNYGEVLINDAPHVGALFASATRITFPDQTPTLPYVLANPTSQNQPISFWQSATTVSHFTLSPLKQSCATSVPANSSCTYLIRLLPPKPGVYKATILVDSAGSTLRVALTGPAGGV